MKIPALMFVMLLVSGCINVKHEPVSNNSIFPESSVVDIAKKDLAQRLNINTAEVKLVRQELVTWRDASLGYPEKGMVYDQVLTPGYRIILVAGNKTYEYHSDYNTQVVGPKEVKDIQ